MRLNINRKISIILLVSIISTNLTGCFEKIPTNFDNIPLMSALQCMEDYKNERLVKKRLKKDVDNNIIDLHNITEIENIELKNTLEQDLKELNQLENNFAKKFTDNLKLTIDNRQLSGNIQSKFYTNNKLYYAFVNFTTTQKPYVDPLKKVASYLGIKGAIGYNQYDEEAVDTIYLKMLVDELNKRRLADNIDPVDDEIEQINYQDEIDLEQEIFEDEDYQKIIGTFSETIQKDETDNYLYLASKSNLFEEIQNDIEIETKKKDPFGRTLRTLIYNSKEFNQLLGLVVNSEYLLPNIQALFKIRNEAELNGYSLYNWGETIEEVKNQTYKTFELVFIYQYDIENQQYKLKTFFPYRIYNGPIQTDLNDILKKPTEVLTITPDNTYNDEFIKEQLSIKLEEFHRAWSNKSVEVFTSQDIILPQDLGLSLLYYRNSITVFDSEMYLTDIIRKEYDTYLCKVEQVSVESIDSDHESGGRYYKEWLIKFKLKNGKIYIDDMYLNNLACLRAPESLKSSFLPYKINSMRYMDSSVDKEIRDNIKETCLNRLEIAVSNGITNDVLDKNGNAITADRQISKEETITVPIYGVYDRFNKDPSILNSKKREKYLNDIKSRINQYGNNNKPTLFITNKDSEWLGISEDKGLVIGKFDFYYFYNNVLEISSYYLTLSNYNNVWVIDEMILIEDKDGQSIYYNVNKDEIDEMMKQFKNNRSY